MSEQEARRYTSICMLREEIRHDMEDYKLLWTDEYVGVAADVSNGSKMIQSTG